MAIEHTRLPWLLAGVGAALKALLVVLALAFPSPALAALPVRFDPLATWSAYTVSSSFFDRGRIAPGFSESVTFSVVLMLTFAAECWVVGFIVAQLLQRFRRDTARVKQRTP
jgi:hypothetical protein